MKRKLLLLLFGLGIFSTHSQVIVDDSLPVEDLIQNVLILGECAQVNNVSSPNNSLIGGEGFNSFGSFDASNSIFEFPFEQGIVLATSGIEFITTGDEFLYGGGPNWEGDDDLNALIQEPDNTNNATVIQFDFLPFVDQISFNYLLASEEYPTFVCNFADTFAFIISGPGISNINDYNHDANPNTPDVTLDLGGLNIALIPGTNIPVSPVNIHPNELDCEENTLGEFTVPQLYDIENSDNGSTAFNGQILPLTATANVIPGEVYSIKLVIADRLDTAFDSAVFIESESFDLGSIDLGPDILIANGDAPCVGETVTLDANLVIPNIQYFWAKDGDIIPNENGQTLEVNEPGEYEVGIQVGDTGTACFGVSNNVLVEFYSQLEFDENDPIVLCLGQSQQIEGAPLNEQIFTSISYQWFKDGEELPNQTNSTLEVSETGIYELFVDANACEDVFNTFNVQVIDYTIELGDNLSLCTDEDDDNTVVLEPIITNLQPQFQDQLQFSWSNGSNESSITVSESGTYTLETSVNGCVETAEVTIGITQSIPVALGDILKCPEDEVILQAVIDTDIPGVIYSWTRDGVAIEGNTPSIDITELGTYQISVNNDGCITTAISTVSGYDVDNCIITQGISPNEDGDNDCMDLTWLNDQLGINKMSVFNRYGRLVFEEDNYLDTFCGQDDNGDMLSTGTYFYVIELQNTDERFERVVKGWVYVNVENN